MTDEELLAEVIAYKNHAIKNQWYAMADELRELERVISSRLNHKWSILIIRRIEFLQKIEYHG